MIAINNAKQMHSQGLKVYLSFSTLWDEHTESLNNFPLRPKQKEKK